MSGILLLVVIVSIISAFIGITVYTLIWAYIHGRQERDDDMEMYMDAYQTMILEHEEEQSERTRLDS